MFWDRVEQLCSCCPNYLREMGLLREMIGIRRRWKRFAHHWKPHCERSQEVIRAAIASCHKCQHAVILGSGWLHDVPLADLSASFKRVTLVDLFHPLRTYWMVRRHPNVKILALDITATLEGVYDAVTKGNAALPQAEPNFFLDDEVNLLVSLNLLSQLPCMAEWFLLRARYQRDAVHQYCRAVLEGHLGYLQRFVGVVTLISDVALEKTNPQGGWNPSGDTLFGCSLPWSGERWIWDIVPPGRNRRGERLHVVGITNLHRAKT